MLCLDMQSGSLDATSAVRHLESGNILLFPRSPFSIPTEDGVALLNTGQADGNFHKNIAYRPATNKLSGLGKTVPGEEKSVRQALSDYSRNALLWLGEVIPQYKDSFKTDYASFRSIEEEGRNLPQKKRNDLLHTDAFPTRPTNGGLILRIFTNINPEKERVWVTSDPFADLAPNYAEPAGLSRIAAEPVSSLSRTFKRFARLVDRSPYDKFMLGFHDFLKASAAYQRDCPKYRFEFPPNSTWMVFTDVVPHSVLAGRFALEQTVIVPREALLNPEKAPASILEKLCGKPLTFA